MNEKIERKRQKMSLSFLVCLTKKRKKRMTTATRKRDTLLHSHSFHSFHSLRSYYIALFWCDDKTAVKMEPEIITAIKPHLRIFFCCSILTSLLSPPHFSLLIYILTKIFCPSPRSHKTCFCDRNREKKFYII